MTSNVTSILEEEPEVRSRKEVNPGKFEDLNRESRGILSTHELFEGIKFEYARIVTKNLNIAHAINMGSQSDPSMYILSTSYADDDPEGSGLLLVGRVDSEGGRIARVHRNFGRATVRLNAQDSPDPNSGAMAIMEADYRGKDFTAEMKTATNGMLSLSYLQNVTPTFAAGVECHYYPSQAVSFLGLAGRWVRNGGNSIWNATLSSMGQASLSYTNKPTEYLAFSSELQASLGPNKVMSQFQFGGEYRVLQHASLRATISSSGKITSMVEETLGRVVRASLAAELDHPQQLYRFGVGFQLQL